MLPDQLQNLDPFRLFSDYLKVTGVAHTGPEKTGDPNLIGKRLGLINGSSWITLWANYFGRVYLRGAHLINVGNEAVQINFMEAYQKGEPTPPRSNIETFAVYARQLVELGHVDAILITCSTMNRAFPEVQKAVQEFDVPVVSIDRPMMERAVKHGGRTLVIATHGPTVKSTQALLQETAQDLGTEIDFCGETNEEAWHFLAEGDVRGHNESLANMIGKGILNEGISSVVLAQLSMTVFLLSYPDPMAEFGIPVFTSGQCGFEYMREVLNK